MKKIFTFCLALLALSSVPAMAQDDDEEDEIDNTFQFYRAIVNGKDTTWTLVKDGDVLTTSDAEENAFGTVQVSSGLYVRNTTDEDADARVHMTIDNLPSGEIQFCMLTLCSMYSNVGVDNIKAGTITAGHNDNMMLEWNPTSYGTATITLQVNPAYSSLDKKQFYDGGVGPKITVNFVYPDPTGITNVTAKTANATISAIYNLRGEQLSKMQKGLNIVRYADGTTKKVIK